MLCWRDFVDLLVVGPEECHVLEASAINVLLNRGRSSGLMSGGAGGSHDMT